jgi:MYXO-CTERM domain-containing protein
VADCGAWLSGATAIYTQSGCLRDALGEFAQHLVAPTATPPWDLGESVLSLVAGETVNSSVLQAVAGQRYRVGLLGWSEAGCPSPPCPRISVSVAGLEVLTHTFEVAASAPVPLGAAVLADTTGSVTLALHAENGTRFELGGLAWVPDVNQNKFDGAPDRAGVVLFDLDTSSPGPAPARFVGDGKEGFAAWLLPNERLLFPRQAIVPGHRWTARFSVTTDPVELTCGLANQAGQPVLEADCSTGSAELDDTGSPSALRAGFFIESSAQSSPALIDDLELIFDPGGSDGAAGSGGIGGQSSEAGAGASGAPVDAGPGGGDESAELYVSGGGCACRSATPGRSAGSLVWALLAGIALRARRRRKGWRPSSARISRALNGCSANRLR